jgi:phosphoribosylglycinamide formyltransferase
MAPPPPQPTRVTVLISGGGTNLQALIDAQQRAGSRPYRVVRVVSNRRDAYGLTRARDAGIPTAYHNLRAYRARLPGDEAAARAAYDADLAGVVLRGSVAAEQAGEGGGGGGDRPDLVVCAGFMHVLGKVFLDRMCEKGVPIINLHPGEHQFLSHFPSRTQEAIGADRGIEREALPGEFDGVGAIARAHEAWMKGEISRTGIMIHYVSDPGMAPSLPTQVASAGH